MRFHDWETRLAAHFASAAERQFAWGEFDCGLAVCDAVKTITGNDPGEGLRGTYASEAEADAIVRRLGDFAAEVAVRFGFREVPPSFAGRGDIVLVNNGNPKQALGIVDLSGRTAVCASERGMKRVRMSHWLRAWKVA